MEGDPRTPRHALERGDVLVLLEPAQGCLLECLIARAVDEDMYFLAFAVGALFWVH